MHWNFLNTSALWALPLVFVPIIFHLLFRKPARTVVFSDLRFLKQILKQSRPRKRLYEWLLLLMRILALACLFFFLARPVLQWGAKEASGDSMAMVILLDASYSMQTADSGVSHWDRAVSMAEKALGSLGDKDRSALIIFSDRIEYNSGGLSGRHEEMSAEAKKHKPGNRTTDFLTAFQTAYKILERSPASLKSILLLSDAAPHGWTDGIKNMESLIPDFNSHVQMVFARFPPAGNNASISGITVAPDFSGNALRVSVSVQNSGTEKITRVPVSLETRGLSTGYVRQSQVLADISKGESASVNLKAPLQIGESVQGRVLLSPDALSPDNVFYFTSNSPKKLKILCAEEPSGVQALTGESFFFREAILSPPSAYEITTVALSEIKRMKLESYALLVLANPGNVEQDISSKISEYLNHGGRLFVACGDRLISANLEELLPVRFGNPMETKGLTLSVLPDQENPESDIQKGYDWDKISVMKIIDAYLNDDAEPYLSFSNAKPLLVFSYDNKTAVWTSSIDRKWNNAAAKPIFPPLMRYVAGRLTQTSSQNQSQSLFVGESLRKKGSSEPFEEPGIYPLPIGNDQSPEFVSVNVDARKGESSSTAVQSDDLKILFPSVSVNWVESGENFQSQFISLMRGKELTRFFLLAAAFFLLMELVLGSRRIQTAAALFVLLLAPTLHSAAVPGNRFILAQLKNGNDVSSWDPYPLASRDILSFLEQTTSVKSDPERRIVTLNDPILFQSPFLLFAGAGRIDWSRDQLERLKKYITGGGLLFVDDRTGEKGGSFDFSFRQELKKMFPEKKLEIVPREHAIFRSFYLLRTVGGRRLTNNYLEGLDVDGRVAVIYSQNDILGAWARDLLGNFLFECSPGGEPQRWESQKLMMNIIIYSVTGNYKTDMIHMPFIEQKLRN